MITRYELKFNATTCRWEIYDRERKRTLCHGMFEDNMRIVYDALCHCHEYYDKPSPPVREVSSY